MGTFFYLISSLCFYYTEGGGIDPIVVSKTFYCSDTTQYFKIYFYKINFNLKMKIRTFCKSRVKQHICISKKQHQK